MNYMIESIDKDNNHNQLEFSKKSENNERQLEFLLNKAKELQVNFNGLKNQIELYQDYDEIKNWMREAIGESEKGMKRAIKNTYGDKIEKMDINHASLDLTQTRFGSIYDIVTEFDHYLNDLDQRLIDMYKKVKTNNSDTLARLKIQSNE